MRTSKYSSRFKALSKNPVFTSAEAKTLGIPARMLAYFCKREVLERLDRGVYRVRGTEIDIDFEWEDLALMLVGIPEGIICLISALCYYNMTDQIMREFWIAVPHSSRSPKRPNTRIIRMRNTSLGQTTVNMGKYQFRIFDRERTVVDAFRYLSKEIAIKALVSYLKGTGKEKPDLKKLLAYAKELHVNIEPYITALIT
jgi:predicted transcriptional regulator of viral defense system